VALAAALLLLLSGAAAAAPDRSQDDDRPLDARLYAQGMEAARVAPDRNRYRVDMG
jgi:predicted outer membrane protein